MPNDGSELEPRSSAGQPVADEKRRTPGADETEKVDRYAESRRLHVLASSVMPGGVSSDVRLGGYPVPLTFTHGVGARLYDVDGNEYLDYAMGMGPNILGHAATAVTGQVESVLKDGQLYAGQHRDEIALAQLLVDLVPCAERVRFCSSGSEAIQAALRLARAATDRKRIVKFSGHYHGWFDNIFVERDEGAASTGSGRTKPMSAGQSEIALQEIDVLPWNNYPSLKDHIEANREAIAAVIMEPIACNAAVILPDPGYLVDVRALCDRYGIVLIFDEVITGFRVALGGAQELLGVTPDLAIFAKAMGNGFPISAVAGSAEILDEATDGAVHAGTYNANRTSVAAALATLSVLSAREGRAYREMDALGKRLVTGIERLALDSPLPLRIQGLGAVFHTYFGDAPIERAEDRSETDHLLLKTFLQILQDRGVRPTARGTWFMSLAHTTDDIDQTLNAVEGALRELSAFRPLAATVDGTTGA